MKICPKFFLAQFNPNTNGCSQLYKRGFTLYELLIVATITGILVAIAAPNWLRVVNSTRLDTAQNAIFQGIRTAQHKAKNSRAPWKFGIRTMNERVQWSIYPGEITIPPDSLWNNLDTNIQLDDETSLRKVGDIYQVQFTHRGDVSGQIGRVTFSIKGSQQMKRCVIVSTFLGAVRQGTTHSKLLDGKSCY